MVRGEGGRETFSFSSSPPLTVLVIEVSDVVVEVPGVLHLAVVRALQLVLVFAEEVRQEREIQQRRVPHVVRAVAQAREAVPPPRAPRNAQRRR